LLNHTFKYLLFFIFIQHIAIDISKAQLPTYSNEFLNIGIDAASLSKGNSVISSIEGVCAGYWNPSGLTSIKTSMEASAMHTNYFSGWAQYDFMGLAYKISDSLALGMSLIRFGVDDIPNTLNLVDQNGNVDYNRISYFSVSDYALLLSIGKKSKIENLSWGSSIKLIYRQQGEFAKAFGFGFDLGAKYQYKKWKFGAVLRDVTSTFNLWVINTDKLKEAFLATNNSLPENSLEITLPKLLLGFGREFKFNSTLCMLTEIDLDIYFDGEHHSLIKAKPISIDPHIGFQISYLQNIYLRFGADRFQFIEDFDKKNTLICQPSLGIGFSFYNFSLDYALTDVGDLTITPVSHIFSIKYAFGKI